MPTEKVLHYAIPNWVIVNRKGMESEFGLHVNHISLIGIFDSKLKVLQVLSKMTKRDLSYMVVSEFDIVNGKSGKYKIGVSGKDFLEKEAVLFN